MTENSQKIDEQDKVASPDNEIEYVRLSEVFESSARRWELIIYPSLFAFIVLALYGFYLIYNLQRDVHYLAISVDTNMTTLAGNMQSVSRNVRAMTVSLDAIDRKVGTLEPMLVNIHSMDQSMRTMTQTTGALNAAAQGMNLHMYQMNRDIGRPMRMFDAFMPW